MAAGDLNLKKSWHPKLLKNRAAVWEKQQEAIAERKRIEALKKEIEDERAAQELRVLAERNGAPKRQERVEFLYSGPGASASEAAEQEREAYLLGKKRIDEHLGKDVLGSAGRQDEPREHHPVVTINKQDLAQKVFLDPLLAIKKQEAERHKGLAKGIRRHQDPLESRRQHAVTDVTHVVRARQSSRDFGDNYDKVSRRPRTDERYTSDRRYDCRDRRHSSRERRNPPDYSRSRYDDHDDEEAYSRRHSKRRRSNDYGQHERRCDPIRSTDSRGSSEDKVQAMRQAADDLNAMRRARMQASREREETDERDRLRAHGRSSYLHDFALASTSR
ncbi:RNA-splicing factor [Savitreella phatthalungensis]